MEAFLASLPDDNVSDQLSPHLVDSFDGDSILTDEGVNHVGSDNEENNLLKGGDSLSILRRRPVSRSIATSATSRKSKSSTKSSRPSLSARARNLKPHENDPFLSVSPLPNVTPAAPKPLEDNIKDDENRSNSALEELMDAAAATRYLESQRGDNAGISAMSTHSPRIPVLTNPSENGENILVKQPFKHSKRPKTHSYTPQPGKLLKERTTSATFRVKDEISKHKAEDRKKAAGRLLKGRLKPMCPVKIEGPTIKHCRGIVSDTQVYGPPPSRVKGRRDQMFDSILREYSGEEKAESIHPTSVASSESDRSSYQDIASGDSEFVEFNKLSSHAGIQISSPGEFSGYIQSTDHNVVVLVDRPHTSLSKLPSSPMIDTRRPVSATEIGLENGNKNVRFADMVKSDSKNNDIVIQGSTNGSIFESQKHKHSTDSDNKSLNEKVDSKPSGEVVRLKQTRTTCKPSDFYINSPSHDDGNDSDTGSNPGRKPSKEIRRPTSLSSRMNSGIHRKNVRTKSSTRQHAMFCDLQSDSDSSSCSISLADGAGLTATKNNRHKPCFKINVSSMENKHVDCEIVSSCLHPNVLQSDDLVTQKTHVFNFIASQTISKSDVEESAEFTMTPRDQVKSTLTNKSSPLVTTFTFETLDAELSSVQDSIRNLIENKEDIDELETHRENNLDDLDLSGNRTVALRPINRNCETNDLSDSENDENEVAVIVLDSDEDELAQKSYRDAEYSDALLSGDTTQCHHLLNRLNDKVSRPTSCWTGKEKLQNDHIARIMGNYETRSDSGCGSDIMSNSHGEEASEFHDEDKEKPIEDILKMEVVATAKDLLKMRKGKSSPSLSSKYPPLCFRINARPPTGKLYFFSYGTEMNSNRLSTYLQKEVSERFWGVLFGFRLLFNKKGTDVEAGAFPTIELDRGSSVEGCLYLLSQSELERLDKCTGYPEHYEHVMFPVWMLNCLDPANYGVAQYCVPALMYVAQNTWINKESGLKPDYHLNQCLKSADLLTPAYREFLTSHQSVDV